MAMRHVASLLVLGLAVSTASSVIADDEPPERCESTNCFNQLRIRDFEVVDDTTLVVFVGTQRCPFKVDFFGPECDLTFIPGGDLTFRPDFLRARREPDLVLRQVCSTDSNIGVDEGPFTRSGGASDDGFNNFGIDSRGRLTPQPDPLDPDPRLSCRIRDIVSLTDDELLEIYVAHDKTAPPPPFGTGQLEVPAEEEQSADSSEAESSDTQ